MATIPTEDVRHTSTHATGATAARAAAATAATLCSTTESKLTHDTHVNVLRMVTLKLILMRIRLKASYFIQIDFSSKNTSRSCKSKQASFAKSDPEMVFGSFCLFARDPAGS